MTEAIKILIIDDNEEDQFTFKRYLTGKACPPGKNYHVQVVATGEEGVARCQADPPDCVLLDLSLPDTDGLSVLRQLAGLVPPAKLCVVMLTGSGSETVAVQALQTGASEYLVKGKFTAEALCHAVGNALEKARYRQQLAQAQADLERFAYAAAHDLKEPLRTVAGLGNMLRKHLTKAGDTKALAYLDHMQDATSRMDGLIQGLLDYSLVNRQQASGQLVDLNHVVGQAVANLRTKMEESGARVQYADLPRVEANEWLLLQLFQNLVGNAIKFRSNRSAVITITARKEAADWLFAVADTGIGMNMEQARQIFEPFKRLHAQHEYEGSGIGLATCQRIVERYGGRIWVESELGKGSTFFFTLAGQKHLPAALSQPKGQ
jgi:signal transduction histidine kinase